MNVSNEVKWSNSSVDLYGPWSNTFFGSLGGTEHNKDFH